MTYLELINAVLLELSYRTVVDFSQLVKPDHEKIKQLVNRVNDTVLDSHDWDFLHRQETISVPANADSVELPRKMRIVSITDSDKNQYYYSDEFERFLNGDAYRHEYTIFNDKILLTPSKTARTLKVLYVTGNHAKDSDGAEKRELTSGDDHTIMPEEYAQTIIFGTCMQFKSNPEHPKYKHWRTEFATARANMKSAHGFNPPEPPRIKLPDWATLGYDGYRRKYHLP